MHGVARMCTLLLLFTCVGTVVSSVVDQNPVEADEAELCGERLLREAGGEGEGLGAGVGGSCKGYARGHQCLDWKINDMTPPPFTPPY